MNRRTYLWILLIAMIGVSSCDGLNKLITPDSKTTDSNNSGSSNDDDNDSDDSVPDPDGGIGKWLFNNPDWNYSNLYEFRLTEMTDNWDEGDPYLVEIVEFNGEPCWTGLSADLFKGRVVWCQINGVNTEISDTSNGYNDAPHKLTVGGDNLYFFARDENQDQKMYKYDGITVTQIPVSDPVASAPVIIDTMVYFRASDGTQTKVYQYDGTSVTALPETDSDGDDSASGLVEVDGYLFYIAKNESQTQKWFRWDGTDNLELDPTKYNSARSYVGSIGSDHYFVNFTMTFYEMYRLSGTTFTQLSVPTSESGKSGVAFGSGFVYPGLNNHIQKLYYFDGTTATQISNTYPSGSDGIQQIISINSKIYFKALNASGNLKLFEYDGLAVTQISDTNPSGSDNIDTIISSHEKVYFLAQNSASSMGLYQYDGADVTRISSVDSAGLRSFFALKSIGDYLYFNSYVSLYTHRQLHKLDSQGTLTKVSYADNQHSLAVYQMVVHNNALYFSMNGTYTGIFQWDGAELTRITDCTPQTTLYGYKALISGGDNLYYFCEGDGFLKIYKWNGSDISSISDPEENDLVFEMLSVDQDLYFIAYNEDATDSNVYKYDGSSVTQISNTSSGDDMAYGLTSFNGALYFVSVDEVGEFNMYKHENGTTSQAFDTNPNGSDDPFFYDIVSNPSVIMGSRMYFVAYNELFESRLFEWDGSTLTEISDVIGPSYVIKMGTSLYFAASDGVGNKVYQYDGTTLTQISNINEGGDDGPFHLTAWGNHLYFGALNTDGNSKLFRWNGSEVSQISNTFPGDNDSPNQIVAVGEKLFFNATNENSIGKLYEYDGAQVSMVTDLSPFWSSDITQSIVFRNDLYFTTEIRGGIPHLMKIDF